MRERMPCAATFLLMLYCCCCCLHPCCSSQWASDPLFLGSYSYLGPSATPADVATLAAPLPAASALPAAHGAADADAAGTGTGWAGSESTSGGGGGERPVLLFAGEACHVKYIGTMHGAYLTGQQQAQLLLQHLQHQQPERAEQQRKHQGQHGAQQPAVAAH